VQDPELGRLSSAVKSSEDAVARVGSALDELATSFSEAFGPVDCD
jgi:hypothetical protein